MQNNQYNDIQEAQLGNDEKMTYLVKNNLGLVYSIAKRFKDRGIELEDLYQIGTLGLIKAIKNFDVSYGVQLSTYSVPYIVGEIKRTIRDDGKIKVSRSVKELAVKINQIKKEYLDKRNYDITIDEIEKILNVAKEDIIMAMEATASNIVSSIDEPIKRRRKNVCNRYYHFR